MNVGELFVNLGIKGADKTVGALSSVKKGLGETASMSLEAKAGIIAAMYALERLFATSGAAGTGLTNFNAVLGVSAKTLQQYQFAARQMGVSNQEVEGSFKSLQSTITKTLMGEGAPKGMARLAQLTGNLAPGDLLKFQQNPELLIQKLQDYAQKEKNVGLRNETLKSFGVGDNMIAAMTRGAFNPSALAKAPTYSDKEISALDKANIAWSNLGTKIEMAVGHFNALHGGQLVSDITKLVEPTLALVGAFAKLAENLKVFEGISKVFRELAGALNDISGYTKGTRSFWGEDLDKNGKVIGEKSMTHKIADLFSLDSRATKPEGVSTPKVTPPFIGPQRAPTTQNVDVNMNLNFQHDGKDHVKTSDSVKKAVKDSYRQMAAQGQGG